jgi:hypothetical protein
MMFLLKRVRSLDKAGHASRTGNLPDIFSSLDPLSPQLRTDHSITMAGGAAPLPGSSNMLLRVGIIFFVLSGSLQLVATTADALYASSSFFTTAKANGTQLYRPVLPRHLALLCVSFRSFRLTLSLGAVPSATDARLLQLALRLGDSPSHSLSSQAFLVDPADLLFLVPAVFSTFCSSRLSPSSLSPLYLISSS